jgi:hypothetical protein
MSAKCGEETFILTEENSTNWYKTVADVTESVVFEIIGHPKTPLSFEKLDHSIVVSVETEKSCQTQSSFILSISEESDRNIRSLVINNCSAKFEKTNTEAIGIDIISLIGGSILDSSVYELFKCSATQLSCELSTLLYVDIHAWKNVTLSINDANLSVIVSEEKTYFNEMEISNKQLQNVHVMLSEVKSLVFDTTCDYSKIYPMHMYIGKNDLSLFIKSGFNMYNFSKIFHLHCSQRSIYVYSTASFFPLMLHNTVKIFFHTTPSHMHICEQEITSPSVVEVYTNAESGQIIFDTISIHTDFTIFYVPSLFSKHISILSVFIDDNIQVHFSNLEIQGFIQIPAHTRVYASDVNFIKATMRITVQSRSSSGSIVQTTRSYRASIPESVTIASTFTDTFFNTTDSIIKVETNEGASLWKKTIRFDPEILIINNKKNQAKSSTRIHKNLHCL